jgi:aminodeoxyfutalosine synthase
MKAVYASGRPSGNGKSALSLGADDIDGTVTEEKIAHDAGARTPQAVSVHELVRLVREAGRRPVERDTVFNVVREW